MSSRYKTVVSKTEYEWEREIIFSNIKEDLENRSELRKQ